MPGSTVTVARSVARFTFASTTPSVLLRNRSMRLTHDAQVMPSIGSTISIGGRCGPAVVGLGGLPYSPAVCHIHTPGQYPRKVGRRSVRAGGPTTRTFGS